MRLRSYGSLSNAFPYSAGLKFRVDGDDGNSTSARIQAYIRASSLLYPRRPQFSIRLSQRPRGKSGEVFASSRAAPTPRLAHHSRSSSYLRPSEHHLHLTPLSIPPARYPRPLSNGGGSARREGVDRGVDLSPEQQDNDGTEDDTSPRASGRWW